MYAHGCVWVQEQKKVGRVSSRVQANALVEAEKARLEVHQTLHYTTLHYYTVVGVGWWC